MKLIGVDFTSAPSRRKPITVAVLQVEETVESVVEPVATDRVAPAHRGAVAASASVAASAASAADTGRSPDLNCRLEHLDRLDSFEAFDAWLQAPDAWVAAFDFPFGLPRAFVEGLGWPTSGVAVWPTLTARLQALARPELVAHCRAWCDARPAGQKFAHRATDASAGSSSSMKWVNPPVVLMLHAGAPRLLAAGVSLPGLHEQGTDPARIAFEGYPGLLARSVLGRESYKSDDPARRLDAPRRTARERLVTALEAGAHHFETRIDFAQWRADCIEDAGADLLDAVSCAAQAAWAWRRRDHRWGLPQAVDPVEGWIIGS